jgi:hypothetical protein
MRRSSSIVLVITSSSWLIGCASSSASPPPQQATPITIAQQPQQQPQGVWPQTQPQPQPQQPAAPPQANLNGTIGGRPFVGRTALMVRTNQPFRKCSSDMTGTGGCSTDKDGFDITISTLRIFERNVTCADLVMQWGKRNARLQSGEHSIELQMQALWPVAPGSSWQTDERVATRDQLSSVSFEAEGNSGGAIGKGSVQFQQASREGGVMNVRFTTSNPNLPTSGSVSGTIPFTVCPEPPKRR